MPIFFDKISFYKLNLNYYTFNTPTINIADKSKREFLMNQLSLVNNEAIYKSDTLYQCSRITEYMPYYWKLQRLIWFSRHCHLTEKTLKNKILLVANKDEFAAISMYFAKQYEQQYVFHWLPGLMTNRKMLYRYFIQSYNLTYMLNLTGRANFTVFVENNTNNLGIAFRELTNGYTSYPFVLFSIDDIFFSTTSSFLIKKSELLVYYYLSLFFSLFYQNISRKN